MALKTEEGRSLPHNRERIELLNGAPRLAKSIGLIRGPKGVIPLSAPPFGSHPVTIRVLPAGYRIAKRSLDVLVAAVALLILFPILLLITLCIRLTSRGPALYRSHRVGMAGEPILFLKFRTMYWDAENQKAKLGHLNSHIGPIFKAKNDPRITPVGHFLRRYSLDELPQFVHVFLGEMTLVGPRPHLPCEVQQYGVREMVRLSVKPGLTCFWQVKGRSDLSFDEWIRLDLEYIEHQSLLTDLKLLAKTPLAVLKGKGAY
jgi:lipopolysaccharide/colanic/teichoic acid biosynthesis glycosyltransferase